MTRVRFAPSPTGNLHIGTVRAALFNWLFARGQKGEVVLRIEDTDMARSKPEFETNILDGLAWLGLDYDEGPDRGGDYGPYRQSERMAAGDYAEVALELVQSGHAYPCFCTEAELEAEKEAAKAEKRAYTYSRKCAALTEAEVDAKKAQGLAYTLKFKMPDEQMTLVDMIKGDIPFDTGLISDFVIIKSDGGPAYNFAVVVDDYKMAITHVVRGEDHISNTPKQLAIFQALNWDQPRYAHLPMILSPDRSKLSKRYGATAVTDYRDQGYVPEAIVNYLSLLGWSAPDGSELMSVDEIITKFSIDRVSKANSIFDTDKLKWMNGQYIRKMDRETLVRSVTPYLSDSTTHALASFTQDQVSAMCVSVQDNLELLSDINTCLDVYTADDASFDAGVSAIQFKDVEKSAIQAFKSRVDGASQLDADTVQTWLDEVVAELDTGKGKVYKPVRIATTGKPSGPHVGEILEIVGKDRVQARLARALSLIG